MALPPVAGYVLWTSPDSRMYSDTAGTTLVTANNSEVKNWEDLSGNGNHLKFTPVSANPANGPIIKTAELNGLRGLRFGENSGGTQVKTGLVTDNNITFSSGGGTLFIVGGFRTAPSGPEAGQAFFSQGNVEFLLRSTPFSAGSLSAYHNGPAVQIFELTARGATQYLQTLRLDTVGDTFTLWLNGTQLATAADTGTVPAAAKCAVGYLPSDGVNSHLNGSIYEVLFYTSALNDTDRASVETFLKNKYGL